MRKNKKKRFPIICPYCGCQDIAKYVYGYPTAESWEKSLYGKVIIGGCWPEKKAYKYRCNNCEKDFGKFHW